MRLVCYKSNISKPVSFLISRDGWGEMRRRMWDGHLKLGDRKFMSPPISSMFQKKRKNIEEKKVSNEIDESL